MIIEILSGLYQITVAVIFIGACIRKKLWLASLMTVLYFFHFLFFKVLRIKYLFPKDHIIIGQISYPLLSGIILSLVAVGFGMILYRKKENLLPEFNPNSDRWIILFLAIILSLSGYIYFLNLMFRPYPIQLAPKMLSYRVIAIIISAVFGSFALYLVSKRNSVKRPNLMRWIVFGISTYFINMTMASSHMLNRMVPVEPKTAFVSLSIIVLIAILPYYLLLLGLTKDFVLVNRREREAGKVD